MYNCLRSRSTINLAKMEKVYVLINVKPGKLEEVASTVKTLPEIKNSSVVTGPYDIIAEIDGETITEVLSIVVKKLRIIEGIETTETLVSVKL